MEQWKCDNGLVVKQTVLGKIVTGYMVDANECKQLLAEDHQMLVINEKPNKFERVSLERFWELENIGIMDNPDSCDDEVALEHYNRRVRVRDGRYEVQWPFKTENPEIAENYQLSFQRLKSVLRKLQGDPELLEKYQQIFHDQQQLGIIEVAPEIPEGIVSYMPHHAVVTPTKETTKVRVVFDASVKDDPLSLNLNECMYRGPVFLNDLCGLILRSRMASVAITSDVEKAFLQISLQKEHRDCTRFLWLKDVKATPTNDNLVIFRYARVAFGVKASPFLLAATIIHHMNATGSETATDIEANTYVDNVLAGRESTSEAFQYYKTAKSLFSSISMNLREWYSNDQSFISKLPLADRGKSTEPSVLGVKWDTTSDKYRCTAAKAAEVEIVASKRQILRTVASVFDPCGWFSSVTVKGKLLIQELWRQKVDWDDILPSAVATQWKKMDSDFEKIPLCPVPRMLASWSLNSSEAIQLNCFCDASKQAYAACVYIRSTKCGKICSLLCFAKVRVSPVKQLTIPKLELMAVVLGTRILKFVSKELSLKQTAEKHVWTDSKCVLGWISSTKVLTSFGENRIKEIRNARDVSFHYVATQENPAGIPTRGLSLQELQEGELWWKGPRWLESESSYKNVLTSTETCALSTKSSKPDGNKQVLIVPNVQCQSEKDKVFDLNRYPTLLKLLRVTCFVERFIQDCKGNGARTRYLCAEEINRARTFWVKRVQSEHFAELFKEKPTSTWKKMKQQLRIFTDNQGFLRCKGRYCFTKDLLEEAKSPKLLPFREQFTDLVIKECHVRVMHSGIKQTLAELRNEFWVCRGRSAVKKVINACVVCRCHSIGPYQVPEEAPLPNFWSSIKKPFSCVGLDYLGPLYVKQESKDQHTVKVWVALFTCAVVRAVHLEVVDSLSASVFIMALRRFMALCGKPDLIISDNAKTFKAAEKALNKKFQEIQEQEEIQDFSSKNGITWKYIVERAPWMGGFYERLVALVKNALRKSLGSWTVTKTEVQTLIYEIGFTLNTRPLLYSEADPGEKVLTPSHFLFRSTEMFPEAKTDFDESITNNKTDLLMKNWKAGQTLLREFWDSWRLHYLLALRESWRPNKARNSVSVWARVGDIVLIKDELPRGSWKVGRIAMLKPSGDNRIRAAEIKLPNGHTIQRPLKSLYPIEGSILASEEFNIQSEVENSQSNGKKASVNQSHGRVERQAAIKAKTRIAQQI